MIRIVVLSPRLDLATCVTGLPPAVDLLPAVETLLGDPDLAAQIAAGHALRGLL